MEDTENRTRIIEAFETYRERLIMLFGPEYPYHSEFAKMVRRASYGENPATVITEWEHAQ
ncbi:MAG TPA: hypothetical protein VMU25_01535 [Candidatus Paceibacterota bacterium]|nr:hypothetical protein [Candidatus Paceibacterota bacterium]